MKHFEAGNPKQFVSEFLSNFDNVLYLDLFDLQIFLKLPRFPEMFKYQWNILQQESRYQNTSTKSSYIT